MDVFALGFCSVTGLAVGGVVSFGCAYRRSYPLKGQKTNFSVNNKTTVDLCAIVLRNNWNETIDQHFQRQLPLLGCYTIYYLFQ
jgi:hypothetical protein